MRKKLKQLKGYNRFSAIISEKNLPSGKLSYILFDVKLFNKNKRITDHLWITEKKDSLVFEEFIKNNNIENGSLISFTARKDYYYRGYYGNQVVARKKSRDIGLTDYKNLHLEKKGMNYYNESNYYEMFNKLENDAIKNGILNNYENIEIKERNDEVSEYKFFLSGFESNWYRCQFKDEEGNIFNCTEQYFMYNKAILFNDLSTANEILKTTQPRFQKSLGRKVKGFNEEIWNENKERIMYEGNLLKYKQNSSLKKLLISTYPKVLVEANPADNEWGIGISEGDSRINDTSLWGKNLMGKVLMKVREELMNK